MGSGEQGCGDIFECSRNRQEHQDTRKETRASVRVKKQRASGERGEAGQGW